MNLKIDDIKDFLSDNYGLASRVKKLYGEIDLNYLVVTKNGKKYILKICSPKRSESILLGEDALLEFLKNQNKSFETPVPVANRFGKNITRLPDKFDPYKFGRLLTFIEGDLWSDLPYKSAGTYFSLGQSLGQLTKHLQSFDHSSAHRNYRWDMLQAEWIWSFNHFTTDQQIVVDHYKDRFENDVVPKFDKLRRSVVHNDANDHNLLLAFGPGREYKISGFIDFGDLIYTISISELAVAIAYAVLELPDPLEAASLIVKGYYQEFPLKESEIAILYDLIALRLLISVAVSAENAQKFPSDKYLQISSKPAWDLLSKWIDIQPAKAVCHFRYACGWEPSPVHAHFKHFLETEKTPFSPVLGANLSEQDICVLDLSPGSISLGNHENYKEANRFEAWLRKQLSKGQIGIGRYLEPRPFRQNDQNLVRGNFGTKWRAICLGIDFFVPEKIDVHAVWDGEIYSVEPLEMDMTFDVFILHRTNRGLTFYTRYKNLKLEARDKLTPGQIRAKGSLLGFTTHLFFQVVIDPIHPAACLPSQSTYEEMEIYASACPYPDEVCGMGLKDAHYRHEADDNLVNLRNRVLGHNLSLSYKVPVHIVRGEMQFLIDNKGRRFLDMVNNVAHVGHENPKIVRAGIDQMAVLNTNTRYLHQSVLSFARKLLTFLPPRFETVYVVNSGSEANELALRMARTYTGGSEMFVIEQGYHGNTSGCIALSSYKFDGPGGTGAPTWVHVLPMPDIVRGRNQLGEDQLNADYQTVIEEKISGLRESNKRLAGFIAEPILSCAGQIVPPAGYFQYLYDSVHREGGVCIADEVQTGCGRVGSHFWAFEIHGVIPDIVTIGKPIGNGHPIGAVATTREIANVFDNGMEYFNTFGGNPVSSKIGMEVLNIIETEDLISNALRMGNYLLEELRSMKKVFPSIGDVRGSGLFLGIELVKDPYSLDPDDALADHILNRMREHCILLGIDGPYRNVIKIKPPMVVTEEDATQFLENLNEIIKEYPLAR